MFGKSIAKKDLEAEFLRYLEKITPKEKWLAVFKETVLDLWEEQGKGFDVAAQQYERQLALLEAKRKRIYEMREDSSYTKEEFLERKQQVDNEMVAAKISVSEARIEQFDIEGSLAYAINFISHLGRQWFDLPPEIRPRFQKLLFPVGLSYKPETGFGTARLGLIYELKETSRDEKSLLVASWGFEPQFSP